MDLSGKRTIEDLYFITGLILLLAAMLFGITGALQYIVPGFLKESISFEKTRPLHVSSAVFWIILAASGSLLSGLNKSGQNKTSFSLSVAQLLFFVTGIVFILFSYLKGEFGGREYWEFPPVYAILIVTGWICMLVNFLKSIGSLKKRPVYVWMWLTGLLSFLFTYIESYLWLIPYFRSSIVNDMTIQWKSYGSMVGSWNMIIYGSSIFLLERITGSDKYSRSSLAFAMYFLGLFNLMFNWGHHIYTLPTATYIKYISYSVSMTELIILARIIYLWKRSLSEKQKSFHILSYRFLWAADIWILFTLLLAILISIPAVNIYTHGTFVTVAHTMGATIGINSMLLLAVIIHQAGQKCEPLNMKRVNFGYYIMNISLGIFVMSLLGAGVGKAIWQMSGSPLPFREMMKGLRPWFLLFFISGITLFAGTMLVAFPLLKVYFRCNVRHSMRKWNVIANG